MAKVSLPAGDKRKKKEDMAGWSVRIHRPQSWGVVCFLCCTHLSIPWSALAFPLHSGAELRPARQDSGAAIVIGHIMVQQE